MNGTNSRMGSPHVRIPTREEIETFANNSGWCFIDDAALYHGVTRASILLALRKGRIKEVRIPRHRVCEWESTKAYQPTGNKIIQRLL